MLAKSKLPEYNYEIHLSFQDGQYDFTKEITYGELNYIDNAERRDNFNKFIYLIAQKTSKEQCERLTAKARVLGLI